MTALRQRMIDARRFGPSTLICRGNVGAPGQCCGAADKRSPFAASQSRPRAAFALLSLSRRSCRQEAVIFDADDEFTPPENSPLTGPIQCVATRIVHADLR